MNQVTDLVEVKNSNSYPWESTASPPNPSLFEGNLQVLEVKRNPKKGKEVGSWGQLAKSFTFLSELFADIPLSKVLVFTALPNISTSPGMSWKSSLSLSAWR